MITCPPSNMLRISMVSLQWGRSNVILALCSYAEAEPTQFTRVSGAILKYLIELNRRLTDTSGKYGKLAGWAAARWIDIALGAEWLLVNAPQGQEATFW